MKDDRQAHGRSGSAGASSLPPALRLLEAQRRVTDALSDLVQAQRLRDEGLLAADEYEHRVLVHGLAQRQLNDLLRWLNATQ